MQRLVEGLEVGKSGDLTGNGVECVTVKTVFGCMCDFREVSGFIQYVVGFGRPFVSVSRWLFPNLLSVDVLFSI